MSTLENGIKLGKYLIVRHLGSGGMADVYEAEDSHLGRRVALKVLPPELARNPQFIQRFESEVRKAASLNHGGIVPVFDFGFDNGTHYYSMRLLTHGSLRNRIDEGLSDAESLSILRDIADALGHATGVFIQSRFGAQEARLSIRGSGLQRTFHLRGIQLFQDGIPLNQADGAGDFQSIELLAAEAAGKRDIAITVSGDTVDEQVALAEFAAQHGAQWLVLQPPRDRSQPEAFYFDFFAEVMTRTGLPCAIQNAPEYLGVGLTPQSIARMELGDWQRWMDILIANQLDPADNLIVGAVLVIPGGIG